MSNDVRTAVVTGAGSGIGRAIATELAKHSVRLLLIGRRRPMLEQTQSMLAGDFHKIAALDVSNSDAVKQAIDNFASEADGLDCLVTNAGVNPQRAAAIDVESQAWSDTFKINLDGVHNCCQAALPHLLKSPVASVVTVGSIAGLKGMKARAAYGPSKAAVINYTQALAADYSPQKVRANCVCPGFVVTDINRDWLNALPAEQRNQLEQRHLLGLGTPEQVASVVWFLASPASSWMTGNAIAVDGGYSCH
ncbi:MAG: SDR family NAD(P)-dependent oxidoreductase [Planctomycetota bacterium]|jgi:NAD(P)-dependent dehydrogenase (short-subunit alcohol dehydrogenase family)|nr:SDR family NAD(P)-dependent oxidoreductase [Planctomycetota bacterium]